MYALTNVQLSVALKVLWGLEHIKLKPWIVPCIGNAVIEPSVGVIGCVPVCRAMTTSIHS